MPPTDWTASAQVSRTQLGLSPLDIVETEGYYITRDGIGPGEGSWRRETVQSPYVHGRFLVNAVRDVQTLSLAVRVRAASTAQLTSRMDVLIDAMQQLRYTLSFNLSGSTFQWFCEPADFAVGDGGQFEDLHLRSFTQVVTFSIPRQPVPALGYF